MSLQKIMFVTQFFSGSSTVKKTGGIISNRDMLRTLSEKYKVYVLYLGSEPYSGEFDNEPYDVLDRGFPTMSALDIFINWNSCVEKQTKLACQEIGNLDLVIATSSTLSALNAVQGFCRTGVIIRAYENFGFQCCWVSYKTRVKLFKQAILRKFNDTKAIRSADVIITNSYFMRGAIAKRFKVDLEKIEVLLQNCGAEIKGCNPKDNSIGFVNRGAEKNAEFVLKLAEHSPELSFHIYGHTEALPENLPRNVHVKGWASDREKMFSSVSLWIVPSCWAEPFGRVSIEAQAMQRSVLVADNGGLPETVLDPRFKIKGFKVAEWRDRIHELLAIDENELVENALKIQKIYSKEAHDNRIREVFGRIMNGV